MTSGKFWIDIRGLALAELTIIMSKNAKTGGRKVNAFLRKAPQQVKKGLRVAGGIVKKQWGRNISGDGFTRSPGISRQFPGVASGTYFDTLFVESKATFARVGPQRTAFYAVFHETGTKNMPARPVVEPTWRMVGEEALDKFVSIAMKPLDA